MSMELKCMRIAISYIICGIAMLQIIACGGTSSSSSNEEFKIKPGDVSKFDTPISGTSYNVTFDGSKTGTYAIIFQNNINGIDYVGIAFGQNPKTNREFKVYISWQSSSISNYTGSASITVIDDNGVRYSNTNATINFTITGPSSNVYDIASDDNITVTHESTPKNLVFNSSNPIKAYLVQ